MAEPAGTGSGELPLHELPLYVLEEVRPRQARVRRQPVSLPTVRAPALPADHHNWRPAESTVALPTSTRQTDMRFARLVMVPFGTCTHAIDQWRFEHSVAGVMMVGRSRLTDARDRPALASVYRLRVELRGGLANRAIPMDLEVTPRYTYATMFLLLPRHRVFLLRRYFRAGHYFLDSVIQAIETRSSVPTR